MNGSSQYDEDEVGGIDIDAKGRIHVAWTVTESSPISGPLSTEGALPAAPSSDDGYDYSQYAIFSKSGALLYATPVADQVDHPDYAFATGLALDPETGTAMVYVRNYDDFSDLTNYLYTPSYRDARTGQQVNVLGATADNFVDDGYRTYIAVFHEPVVENTIVPFATGSDQFCIGSLISQSPNFGPIQGSNPRYVSGDGSSAEHNLPTLYTAGVPMDHPQPKTPKSTFVWQKSTDNGVTWVNIPGGNKALLKPEAANQAGVLKFRRLIVGSDTSISNVISATIVPGFSMQVTAPTDPISYCPGITQNLGITVSGASGNITWQWYDGFTPLAPGMITPVYIKYQIYQGTSNGICGLIQGNPILI